MVEYNLGNMGSIIGGMKAPTMPTMPAGGAGAGGGFLNILKNAFSPASQGGNLEGIMKGLHLFGMGLGGRDFGAGEMAESSLANTAATEAKKKQDAFAQKLMEMMGGMTPKGQPGGSGFSVTPQEGGGSLLKSEEEIAKDDQPVGGGNLTTPMSSSLLGPKSEEAISPFF